MRVIEAPLTHRLALFVEELLAVQERITSERAERLGQLAAAVAARVRDGERARLVFICTHNSRRSQLAQVWAQTAARAFGVPGVETFSGGTEATTFSPGAVAALERAGFLIDAPEDGANPVYRVRYAEGAPPMECFSKVWDRGPNPRRGFVAVMTCSDADDSCPVVHGAAERISLPYRDPGRFDGSAEEASGYDGCCREIGREMLAVFRRVGQPRTEG